MVSTTHFDSLRIGAGKPVGDQTQRGAATTGVYVTALTPDANSTTALATGQTVSGANMTLTAGTGITTTTIDGTTHYVLDVPRNVSLTGQDATTSAVAFTVTGRDKYKVPMTETLTGPAATGTVTTSKAFAYISAIAAAGNTVSGVAAGTSSTLGLDYRADAFGDVIINVNNVLITSSAGFTAADTTTATASTGDVRGTYAMQTAPDGSVRVVIWHALLDVSTTEQVYGVTQA